MGRKKKARPISGTEAELHRTRELLRDFVERSLFTQSEVAVRCGWSDSRLSRMIAGATGLRVRDLLTVLGAIHVQPREFYFRLYG